MKTFTRISAKSLLLFIFLLTGGYAKAQQNSPERQAPAPKPQSNTVILSEEEYLALKKKAENPVCPKVSTASPIQGSSGDSRIAFRLGGGLNYVYGADTRDNQRLNPDRISWYAEGMLGYALNSDRQGLRTLFAAFVNVGNSNQLMLEKIMADGETGITPENRDIDNRYGQVELGVLFFETIRLSAGAGMHEYRDTSGSLQDFQYYSGTAGLSFGTPYFKVVADLNLMYGREMNTPVVRPMIGLAFQL